MRIGLFAPRWAIFTQYDLQQHLKAGMREANQMIKSLEEKDDLDNSVESYQELIKLNNLIEKKFQKNLRSISENTNKKIKDIIKRK